MLGEVKISDEVIATISNIATNEIKGISGLSGGLGDVFGIKNPAKGVRVNKNDMSVDLYINVIINYGTNIVCASELVQKNVKTAVETMCAVRVSSVNINVVGINADFLNKEKLSAEANK